MGQLFESTAPRLTGRRRTPKDLTMRVPTVAELVQDDSDRSPDRGKQFGSPMEARMGLE